MSSAIEEPVAVLNHLDESKESSGGNHGSGKVLTDSSEVTRNYEFKRSYLTASSKARTSLSRRRTAPASGSKASVQVGGINSNKLASTTDNEDDDDDDDEDDAEMDDLLNIFKQQVLQQQNMIYKNMKNQLRYSSRSYAFS